MAHLQIVRAPDNCNLAVGTVFPLTADRTIIGRGVHSATLGEEFIYLPHHAIGRRHAAIVKTESGYIAQDLQSRSGIWVNGKHHTADNPAQLADGDVIKICDFQFQFVEVDPHIVTG